MTCISLKETFGRRYRVTLEQDGLGRSWADPWRQILLAKFGHIYPHGGDLLGVAVDAGRVVTAGKIRKLICCRVTQAGDNGELNAVFDVKDFAKVAAIIKPRKRRRMTAEQWKATADQLAAARKCLVAPIKRTPGA